MFKIKQKLKKPQIPFAKEFMLLSTKERYIVVFCVTLAAFIWIYTGLFLPRQVHFSYAGDNCHNQITFMPCILQDTGTDKDNYSLIADSEMKIAGYPVAAGRICVTAKSAPSQGEYKVNTSPFGLMLFSKAYKIKVAPPPKLDAKALDRPILVDEDLQIPLSSRDNVYAYELYVSEKGVECPVRFSEIACKVPDLSLEQGRHYDMKLVRRFEDKNRDVLLQDEIETLSATKITKSSIKDKQMVFDKPDKIHFKADIEQRAQK